MNPTVIQAMLKSFGLGDIIKQAEGIGHVFVELKLQMDRVEARLDAIAAHLDIDVPMTPDMLTIIANETERVISTANGAVKGETSGERNTR